MCRRAECLSDRRHHLLGIAFGVGGSRRYVELSGNAPSRVRYNRDVGDTDAAPRNRIASHGPAVPTAVHERGSQGCRGSVALVGTARLGLLTNGPGTVVVVDDPTPWPEGTADFVDDDAGADVEGGPAGGLTAMLEPVTSTTLALSDADSGEPTSMVLMVLARLPRCPAPVEAGPVADALAPTSPGA